MKVSTDACLLGAWAPFRNDIRTVLDVGAGTGLLTLMLAQRFPEANYTALEIDTAAAAQASDNFRRSPFAERVDIVQADARGWCPAGQYDALICNPPFFQASLKGPDERRNLARHDGSFRLQDLLELMSRSLKDSGEGCVLLPASMQENWEQLVSDSEWNIARKLRIHPHSGKPFNRVITLLTRAVCERHEEDLSIYENPGKQYSAAFEDLLRPFYQ
jgi:tRNA1Val (adenine37-N6)-methyltransferase